MRVDLHCHSSFSDGERSPEQLADLLAQSGVRWAALTDHETIHGQVRFHSALEKRNICTISGVEIEVQSLDGPVHLLAYGFDQTDSIFINFLASLRHPFWTAALSWFKRVRGSRTPVSSLSQDNGKVFAEEAIWYIQQAGGCAFLAHPLTTFSDRQRLEEALERLVTQGLDGIEAYYKPYSMQERNGLVNMAERHNLLVCAGSDFHGAHIFNGMQPGMDMPEADWLQFFDRVVQKLPPARQVETKNIESA